MCVSLLLPRPHPTNHTAPVLSVSSTQRLMCSQNAAFFIAMATVSHAARERAGLSFNSRRSRWSAIQTLLERSMSDVLILLDCCAGAASATFPNGKNITETISASSWDAIAPDPGRYSFTNALIEVLQEWRHRTFSAAMLHAEILARLKHPRPILINGKHFEARSTPVHFMMTSNHKAPSIEFARVVPEKPRPPSPPRELPDSPSTAGPGSQSVVRPGHSVAPLLQDYGRPEVMTPESSIPDAADPNEDEPHVMISLALEEDQRLDLGAWEQWLASFPALAKFVKVQGVFKSHSTLLLLSLPVMVWDLLPDDPACAFVAFIRSNNLLKQQTPPPEPVPAPVPADAYHDMAHEQPRADVESILSGTTFNNPIDGMSSVQVRQIACKTSANHLPEYNNRRLPPILNLMSPGGIPRSVPPPVRNIPSKGLATSSSSASAKTLRGAASAVSLSGLTRQHTLPPKLPSVIDSSQPALSDAISRQMILNQSRDTKTTTFVQNSNVPEPPRLAKHVISRLENYFQKEPQPTVAVAEFLASNLGVETSDIHLWFHHRRQQERMKCLLQNLKIDDTRPAVTNGARMILPGDLNTLLEIFPSTRSVLLVDLRSSTDFEKSHIHGAINLRAPLSFIQNMPLESIQDTFVDDQSRRTFNKWFQSRCMVFYDRVVEYGWECPVADALCERFRRKGWLGQCFILKGHYREFSDSFDNHISGSKMTSAAKEHLDGFREHPTPSAVSPNLCVFYVRLSEHMLTRPCCHSRSYSGVTPSTTSGSAPLRVKTVRLHTWKPTRRSFWGAERPSMSTRRNWRPSSRRASRPCTTSHRAFGRRLPRAPPRATATSRGQAASPRTATRRPAAGRQPWRMMTSSTGRRTSLARWRAAWTRCARRLPPGVAHQPQARTWAAPAGGRSRRQATRTSWARRRAARTISTILTSGARASRTMRHSSRPAALAVAATVHPPPTTSLPPPRLRVLRQPVAMTTGKAEQGTCGIDYAVASEHTLAFAGFSGPGRHKRSSVRDGYKLQLCRTRASASEGHEDAQDLFFFPFRN